MKRLWITLIASLCCSALSACGLVGNEWSRQHSVEIDGVNIDEVVAVLSLSRDPDSVSRYLQSGYFAFLKKNGQVDLVKNDFVERVDIVWNEHGLLLTDKKTDILLRPKEKPLVRSVTKESLGNDFSFVTSDFYMTFWNWGFSRNRIGGYDYEMIVGNEEKAKRYELPFSVDSKPVMCGGKILAVTQEDFTSEDFLSAPKQLREFYEDGTSVIVGQTGFPVDDDDSKSVPQPFISEYFCLHDKYI
ncbi:MAG: hypothetical protein J6M18_00585 [Actinomycetaceae bacterium]|nr:hypothetical protein [Actinomycetaceae bacterium]